MAYNGSGVFTRLYSWVDDRDNGVKIRADRFDAELDGIATALSTAILKDGTQTITADIPFSGNKITGLGDPTSAQDAATKTYVDTNFQPLNSDLTALAAVTDVSHLTDIGGLTLANGDIFYVSGGAITNLAKGTDGQYLSLSSGLPAWADVASLTVSGSAIQKGDGAGGLTDAVSGTDYAPATSGTAILKGDGSGGFGAAASGTDYAPATSGTAILKGDGSGGFASASAGSDYVASETDPIVGAVNGIVKADGAGNISAATAGTDYATGFSVISTTDVSGTTPAELVYTGLDSYQEVIFIFQDITHSDASNARQLYPYGSHDGGSTYGGSPFASIVDLDNGKYLQSVVRLFMNPVGNCEIIMNAYESSYTSTTSGANIGQADEAPDFGYIAGGTQSHGVMIVDAAETMDTIKFLWEASANFSSGTVKMLAR